MDTALLEVAATKNMRKVVVGCLSTVEVILISSFSVAVIFCSLPVKEVFL
jgi:hypothetical protein